MPISTGTRFGSYEILSQIGAGGMGEVYQAHDTKLGRDVAIKVLPQAFAHDPERLSRFQREAKMLASLNHPNIATIHGLEQSNGTTYLVMELVSGETLAERVKRDGAVPVEESLGIAKQIAEALEAAHEKGIIHRDLKPANVKVTSEGKVKVLDFGLAKAFAGEVADSNPSQSPTLSAVATMQGVLLGTAAYMSPEQARGKAVDKRTDIWAFGCVLYELLTGKQAFAGETVTDIIAKILQSEPDWRELPPATPTKISDLLRRCLQKDQTLRFRDAGDARIEIQEVLTTPTKAEFNVTPITRPVGARRLMLWAIAFAAGMILASIALWNLKPSPPVAAPVGRSIFSLPAGDRLRGEAPAVALSPDGTHMVYVASRGGVTELYLRSMDNFESRPVSGTEGAEAPFFSPDSQWIGFFADSKLKKIPIAGGAAVTLCPASVGSTSISAAWGNGDNIIFQNTITGGLWQVSAAGGTPKRLSTLAKGESTSRWPAFLPGGKAVLFAASNTAGGSDPQLALALYRLDTGRRVSLLAGTRPSYVPAGYLVYAQGGTLMAVPFDLRRMEVKGTAMPVVEGVESSGSGMAQYSISNNGTLVYVPGGIQGAQSTLVWVDRTGAERPLPVPPHGYRTPRISPDGKRLALVMDELGGHVWMYDLVRDTLSRVTFEAGGTTTVAWTRDGRRVVFNSGVPANLFWQPADGSGRAERLTTSENQQNPYSWSQDGQALGYNELDPATSWDIWLLRLSDHKAQPFLRTSSYESAPEFSPDGHWLAYVSDESGRFEIYVQPYPGPGGKWQVSSDGGAEPVWNPNGRELFYRNGPKMMAVEITTQPGFSAGKPRMLFERPYLSITSTTPSYDVAPDGQRFLMLKGNEETQTTQINIVQNWSEELKRRVPPGK